MKERRESEYHKRDGSTRKGKNVEGLRMSRKSPEEEEVLPRERVRTYLVREEDLRRRSFLVRKRRVESIQLFTERRRKRKLLRDITNRTTQHLRVIYTDRTMNFVGTFKGHPYRIHFKNMRVPFGCRYIVK